ncbi:hypothetical protein O4H49_03135 [Kiloniella laminariae]|uniref:Uncharacterized protein n=1 Tax=Kiloniella laminariae TaxID=454162 RepID=A0ABT4LF87_9PROT|nr:hypothetical protein [Kiloniella laminariae]MCZ4279757.1 hypothetical protein [Kiloniella laminariae]
MVKKFLLLLALSGSALTVPQISPAQEPKYPLGDNKQKMTLQSLVADIKWREKVRENWKQTTSPTLPVPLTREKGFPLPLGPAPLPSANSGTEIAQTPTVPKLTPLTPPPKIN